MAPPVDGDLTLLLDCWPIKQAWIGTKRGYAATKMRKVGFTTKWAMILRSPAENENAGISFHMVLSSTRHSRAPGNPGLLRRISLDTRFRGYDGTQAGLSFSPQTGIFKGGMVRRCSPQAPDTKVFVGCASRTDRSRNISRKERKGRKAKRIVISTEGRNPS
jgi:hypothetical protein